MARTPWLKSMLTVPNMRIWPVKSYSQATPLRNGIRAACIPASEKSPTTAEDVLKVLGTSFPTSRSYRQSGSHTLASSETTKACHVPSRRPLFQATSSTHSTASFAPVAARSLNPFRVKPGLKTISMMADLAVHMRFVRPHLPRFRDSKQCSYKICLVVLFRRNSVI